MSSRLEALPPPPLLGVTPFPAKDEHFGSYLRRLAIANGRHSLWAIVSDMGLNSLKPISPDAYWKRLIDATGLEAERLAPLRIPHSGNASGDTAIVAGITIQRGFLDRVHLRSCPACVEQDGLLLASFAIRQVTACARHGLAILDECPCGRRLKAYDRGALWNCPACGTEIADMPRVAAEPGEIVIAKAMLVPAELTKSQLPTALLDEQSTARAALIERLGTLSLLEREDAPATSLYNTDRRKPDKADNGRRLDADRRIVLAAAELLADWPKTYHATFARLMDRHTDPHAAVPLDRRFASRAGRLAVRPFVDHDSRTIDFADEARLAFLRGSIGYTFRKEAVMRPSTYYERMPTTPSAVVSIDRTDEHFVSAQEFAKRVHVGDPFHIEAWFEAALIGTVKHVDGSTLVLRQEFEALVSLLRDLPSGDGAEAGYDTSAKLNDRRGRFYRQRDLLEDVTRGRIRSRSAGNGKEGLHGRLLHQQDFERQRLLCKVAKQIITDEFIAVCSFVPKLWGCPAPGWRVINPPDKPSQVRWIEAKSTQRLAIRDMVALIQNTGERRIFDTGVDSLTGRSVSDWRKILVDDGL